MSVMPLGVGKYRIGCKYFLHARANIVRGDFEPSKLYVVYTEHKLVRIKGDPMLATLCQATGRPERSCLQLCLPTVGRYPRTWSHWGMYDPISSYRLV